MPDTQPTCFVVSEIGEAGSATRTRADKILQHVIVPAAQQAGFAEPERSDRLIESGMISAQIVQRLIEADVVVADLTGLNANVFYELALRHAFRKPAALLYQPSEKIPFDVHDLRCIPVTTDVDDALVARAQLSAMLVEIRENPNRPAVTPFTQGIDLASAIASSKATPESLNTAFMERLDELTSAVAALGRQRSSLRTERPPISLVFSTGHGSVAAGQAESVGSRMRLTEQSQNVIIMERGADGELRVLADRFLTPLDVDRLTDLPGLLDVRVLGRER